jgi:2-succinyl-6-hydroxy-2,4-cyclohexadiene-1-carboxylate synthase
VRLCLVHGFTQTGASWEPVAAHLRAAGHDVVTPDAPGHGSKAATAAGLWDGARALADEVGPAVWVGYSMGGRLALHVALAEPAVVTRLVVVSTTAGIGDKGDRAARHAADAALAAEIERDGIEAFVAAWLRGPMWATLAPERAGREQRLANTAAGLAASLRLAGAGAQEPLWDRLPAIGAPTLVVTGELDRVYRDLGRRMATSLPHATLVEVPNAGHAVPWEQPELFAATIAGWLTQ